MRPRRGCGTLVKICRFVTRLDSNRCITPNTHLACFTSPQCITEPRAGSRSRPGICAEHISCPYRTWTSLEGIDPSYARHFDHVIEQKGAAAAKLNHLAMEICHVASDDDLLMFFDGDAFPIADPMPLSSTASRGLRWSLCAGQRTLMSRSLTHASAPRRCARGARFPATGPPVTHGPARGVCQRRTSAATCCAGSSCRGRPGSNAQIES